MVITAIGFANKFYTLWQISEETKPLGNGRSYVITHYTYVKNISFDKETAFTKYPGATFNENLRGMNRSWDSAPKEVWDNVDTFRFGKYAYTKIADNTDTNYIAWYWEQISNEHKEYVGSVLKSRGYEIRTWGNDNDNQYLVSPEALENERMAEANKNTVLEVLKKNNPFNISFDHNPSSYGICRIDDILYHFQQVHVNYYQGFEYYLPVVNGKQKRVKNKNLVIKNYTYRIEDNGLVVVEILDFDIVK